MQLRRVLRQEAEGGGDDVVLFGVPHVKAQICEGRETALGEAL